MHMYNKAKEENKWKKWKNEADRIMKELCVLDDIINELRDYDWEIFKVDRRFYEKEYTNQEFDQIVDEKGQERIIDDISDLLNEINDMFLYDVLMYMDNITVRIIFMKYYDFLTGEIAKDIGILKEAVRRMRKLRKR